MECFGGMDDRYCKTKLKCCDMPPPRACVYNPSCIVHSGKSEKACLRVKGCTWYPHSASFGGRKPLGLKDECFGVSYGNHCAVNCNECIQYDCVTHGEEYCSGVCKWDPNAKNYEFNSHGVCIDYLSPLTPPSQSP